MMETKLELIEMIGVSVAWIAVLILLVLSLLSSVRKGAPKEFKISRRLYEKRKSKNSSW